MNDLKKIVIIGPESTGKSTLSKQLADHYNTLWCPEFAREYLLKNGMDYNYDDLLHIAKGQVALEEKYIASMVNGQWSMTTPNASKESTNTKAATDSPLTIHHSPLFIDTDMYVLKVWCEYVFGKCHRFILDQIIERKYDMYLLCNTDLPWVKDELREYPDLETREKLFEMYKDCMINQTTPWVIIVGNEEKRLKTAIQAVDGLLKP